MKPILFESAEKPKWIEFISSIVNSPEEYLVDGHVILKFGVAIQKSMLDPFHLVTLACLIQFFVDKRCIVYLSKENEDLYGFIYEDLKFREYWGGKQDHVETKHTELLNLWRVVQSQADFYSLRVEEYFRQNFFAGKDLSLISNSLSEAFYNVFDHAHAGNNAFSFIKYVPEKKILYTAISDFGIGICKSVRNCYKEVTSDTEALQKAVQENFTVRSTARNRGWGLSNILSSSDLSRIVSNRALLLYREGRIKTFPLPFDFKGTMIYLEKDLSLTEDVEIIDEFNL